MVGVGGGWAWLEAGGRDWLQGNVRCGAMEDGTGSLAAPVRDGRCTDAQTTHLGQNVVQGSVLGIL